MELFVFDDDYVRRLREGNSETAAHFHAYFRDLLLLKLRRRLRTLEAIDEVRQEVYTRCIAHLDQLQDARKLGAFVNAICNRVLMEYYRAEGRTESLEEQSDDALAGAAINGMDAALDSARNSARVRRVLETLDQRDSDILRAVFLEEADKAEICRRFGVERDYLRVLIHRAKEKFKAQYLRRKSGRMSIFETFGGHTSLRV
ncbi:MAG TPA: sigma-70 family RNA polymerase sigma factor [Thermoanaerobaculia bacterium]|jgi:RNA polymerase sigma-70 factor (ECF subfamily)